MNAAEPIKLLILGQDGDMFPSSTGAPNDTRERHLGYVRELLRRRPGSEVRIAVHTRRGEGRVSDRPFEGLTIYGTDTRTRLGAALGLLRLMGKFRRAGWIPDVISCQTGYEEGLLTLLVRDRRSRVQIQVHNDFYGAAFGNASLKQRLIRAGTRMAIRLCDQARVVSRGIAQAIVDAGDLTSDRIALAPVPVVFASSSSQPSAVEPILLFVGRLVPQKGLELWSEVAKRIHAQLPSVRFVIAGDGPSRETMATALAPLHDRVQFLGSVAYDELREVYAHSSVFLLTSHYEGLGRVVVEAMLAEVPVVSTNIVGPQDLITDGVTGRLVERDAEALAAAVLELLEDMARAREMARAAKEWAVENYSFEKVTGRLIDSWEAAAVLPERLM